MIDPADYIQLAHWMAMRFLRQHQHMERETDDVHAEAMVGLLKACRFFDPDLGFRFTTYGGTSIYRHLGTVFIHNRMKKKRTCPTRVLSLSADRDLRHGQAVSLLDTIASDDDAVERTDVLDAQRDILRHLLARLHPQAREVIRLRFWDGLLLREVADRIGLTRQRVQQIERAAMRKMGALLSR